ncbi:MAG: hypothetical protein OYH77_04665 [Pseudomonadota bacterium]|nr:hypothetical protein [Pseudomonadota bacterium]
MKRQIMLGITLVGAVSIGCKPMHRQQDSQVSYIEAQNGVTITAVAGEDGRGVCMLKSRLGASGDEKPRLLTVDGSVSDSQLQDELRFLGYGEQVAALILTAVGGGALAMHSAVKIVTEVAAADVAETADDVAGVVKKLKGGIGGIIIGASVAAFGGMGYFIIRGNMEGEKAAPIAARTLLLNPTGNVALAPIVEHQHRSGRLKSALSDKERWQVTNRKMSKLTERIRDIDPDYNGGCDHIKDELKR